MSLPTNLSKPIAMVSGSTALASDVNTDLDYITDALNVTNGEVNTRTQDLTFSGNGLRVTGLMSSTPRINRLLFQTSSATSGTSVGAIPNGSAPASGANFTAFAKSDADNSPFLQIACNETDARFTCSQAGTGAYLPLAFTVDGAEVLKITASGTLTAGNTPKILLNATVLPVYTSNALALAGGLTAGMVYRNGDNLCVVH